MQNPEQLTKVTPYIFLDGCCEEALEFYKKALGATVSMMMRMKDSPDPNTCAPGQDNKILHACFHIGNAAIMASDGHAKNNPEFKGFALSVSAKDEADANRMFKALVDGGNIQMPLTKTFFSPLFGMVTDRFGIMWMVNVVA